MGKQKEYCFACGVYVVCESHHIVPIVNGGMDVPKNLIPLCTVCHHLITHGCTDVPNITFIMKELFKESSQANREMKLFILLMMKLIGSWASDPENAYNSLREQMSDLLNPEIASFNQKYIPNLPAPYGYKYSQRQLSQVPSEQVIITKLRELNKNKVSDQEILEALNDLNKQKTQQRHNRKEITKD